MIFVYISILLLEGAAGMSVWEYSKPAYSPLTRIVTLLCMLSMLPALYYIAVIA